MTRENESSRYKRAGKTYRATESMSTPVLNATSVNAGTVDASEAVQTPAIKFDVLTTIPVARIGPGAMKLVANSTGVMPVLNTTGTTWVYLNVTSVLA
jgi:hypothetical protein